jgi:hypothetical protein
MLLNHRYIKSGSREQLERLFGAKTETFTETLRYRSPSQGPSDSLDARSNVSPEDKL